MKNRTEPTGVFPITRKLLALFRLEVLFLFFLLLFLGGGANPVFSLVPASFFIFNLFFIILLPVKWYSFENFKKNFCFPSGADTCSVTFLVIFFYICCISSVVIEKMDFSRAISCERLLEWAGLISLFILFRLHGWSEEEKKNCARFIVLTGCAYMLIAFFCFFQSPTFPDDFRFFLPNRNYMGILASALLSFSLFGDAFMSPQLRFFSGLVFLAAIFQTGSLAALASGCFLFFSYIYISGKNSNYTVKIKKTGFLWSVFFLFLVSLLVAGDRLIDRVIDTFEKRDLFSFRGRLPMWLACLDALKENFFSGYGLSSTPFIIYLKTGSRVLDSHNMFIERLVETGFTGFMVFCAFLFHVTWRALQNTGNPGARPFIFSFFSFLLASFFTPFEFCYALSILFFIVAALSIEENRLSEKQNSGLKNGPDVPEKSGFLPAEADAIFPEGNRTPVRTEKKYSFDAEKIYSTSEIFNEKRLLTDAFLFSIAFFSLAFVHERLFLPVLSLTLPVSFIFTNISVPLLAGQIKSKPAPINGRESDRQLSSYSSGGEVFSGRESPEGQGLRSDRFSVTGIHRGSYGSQGFRRNWFSSNELITQSSEKKEVSYGYSPDVTACGWPFLKGTAIAFLILPLFLFPLISRSLNMLGIEKCRRGEIPEALKEFQLASTFWPWFGAPHKNEGILLYILSKNSGYNEKKICGDSFLNYRKEGGFFLPFEKALALWKFDSIAITGLLRFFQSSPGRIASPPVSPLEDELFSRIEKIPAGEFSPFLLRWTLHREAEISFKEVLKSLQYNPQQLATSAAVNFLRTFLEQQEVLDSIIHEILKIPCNSLPVSSSDERIRLEKALAAISLLDDLFGGEGRLIEATKRKIEERGIIIEEEVKVPVLFFFSGRRKMKDLKNASLSCFFAYENLRKTEMQKNNKEILNVQTSSGSEEIITGSNVPERKEEARKKFSIKAFELLKLANDDDIARYDVFWRAKVLIPSLIWPPEIVPYHPLISRETLNYVKKYYDPDRRIKIITDFIEAVHSYPFLENKMF